MEALTKIDLDSILKMFVADERELREWTKSPFKQNGYYYATDASSAIRISTSEVEINYPDLEKPSMSILPVDKNCDFKISISEMESKLIPELIDEVKQVGGTEKCPVCDGDGEVEWEFESYTKEDSCPKCDGGGFKDEVKKIQTGNKIADNESPFKMYGTGYFYKELRRLIDACKAAGIENIKQVRADKRTANIFDCSLFTIYVMPANVYDDGDRVKILF